MPVAGGPVLVNLLRGVAPVALWLSGVVLVCTDAQGAHLHMTGQQRGHRVLYVFGGALFAWARRNTNGSHDHEADDGEGHEEKSEQSPHEGECYSRTGQSVNHLTGFVGGQ